MNGEVEVINVLLKHPKIDINAEGVPLATFGPFLNYHN
jgi:hypothetical protein